MPLCSRPSRVLSWLSISIRTSTHSASTSGTPAQLCRPPSPCNDNCVRHFDPSTGRPVVLDTDSLADKMIGGGRGGYCFLSTRCCSRPFSSPWGLSNSCWLGRPIWRHRWRSPPRSPPATREPRSVERHPLADVGFGGGGVARPLAIPSRGQKPTSQARSTGWSRMELNSSCRCFKTAAGPLCTGFIPEPVPFIDVEVEQLEHPLTFDLVDGNRPHGRSSKP